MISKNIEVFKYNEIDSTNNEAQRLIEKKDDFPFWVVADTQTSGRGRKNRFWSSLKGNFMGTLVLKISIEKQFIPQLSFITSLAIKETVDLYKKSKGFKVMVKWPNDIIINDRKCAGILIENLKGKGKDFEFLAIGIGVNLILHPKNTAFKSTNLLNELGIKIKRDDFLIKLSENLINKMNFWEKGKNFPMILSSWLESAYKLNEVISMTLPDGKIIEGIFLGLNDEGGLILSHENKETVFYTGEIYENL